ncbi:aldehyde dehydrogenase family protein, partial [Arthrobacter deserti]|nr:aldehyde dehydrogenase family protein [Arthrobacter deserti]
IARLVTREMGMPLAQSEFHNAAGPAALLRYYAGIARGFEPEERRAPFAFDGVAVVRRNPVGVVAAIVPWNFPMMLLATKLGPALAAGCTVVVKPAEENALSGSLLGEILAAARVPAGVVDVAAGGPGFAGALVRHPHVDKVAFTGST